MNILGVLIWGVIYGCDDVLAITLALFFNIPSDTILLLALQMGKHVSTT